MLQRIMTVLIGVPIVVFCTYSGGLWFFLMVTSLAVISLNEFFNLMKSKGLSPYYTLGNFFTLLFIVFIQMKSFLYLNNLFPWLSTILKDPSWESAFSGILTAAIISIFCAAIFIRRTAMATVNIAITVLGTLYVGWLFSYLVLLRDLTPHGACLFFLMITIWANDTAAYLIGGKFGKKQLSPYISPKKTVVGAVAGFVFALAVAFIFGMLWEKTYLPANWIQYLVLGALIGVFSQLSDLSESLIKRDAGAKDSSRLVPGHGGVLDRMDSFIFAAPVAYYFLVWFIIK